MSSFIGPLPSSYLFTAVPAARLPATPATARWKSKLVGSYRKQIGGETGIRTLDRVSPIHAFQACAFSHSAISPGHAFRIALPGVRTRACRVETHLDAFGERPVHGRASR